MSHVITISWSTEDVHSVRPDLTDEQAATVLEYVLDNHDANEGINWGVLENAADMLFGSQQLVLDSEEVSDE